MSLIPRPIEDFKLPEKDDPTELIRSRFLCQGGGLLLCGYTHIGKSSLAAQIAVMHALNRATCGFAPARPLRSLIVQAENDDGDIAEQREGILDSIGLPVDEYRKQIPGAVQVCHASGERGAALIFELESQLTLLKPDILWLDPALAFHSGDNNKTQDVSKFLRAELNPLILRHKIGCGIVAHMNKPVRDNGKRRDLEFYELLYAATGSMEWANWARAIVVVMPDGEIEPGKPRQFSMTVPKRGTRLGWVNHAGDIITTKYLQHSEDGIAWQLRNEIPTPDSALELSKLLPLDGAGLTSSEWQAASKMCKSTFMRQRRIVLAYSLARQKDSRYWRTGVNGVT